jgi:hypothetical protein
MIPSPKTISPAIPWSSLLVTTLLGLHGCVQRASLGNPLDPHPPADQDSALSGPAGTGGTSGAGGGAGTSGAGGGAGAAGTGGDTPGAGDTMPGPGDTLPGPGDTLPGPGDTTPPEPELCLLAGTCSGLAGEEVIESGNLLSGDTLYLKSHLLEDAQGQLHVAYDSPQRHVCGVGCGIHYARRTPSGWEVEVVDAQGTHVGAMAFDSAGRPHVVFTKSVNAFDEVYLGSRLWQWTVTQVTALHTVQYSPAIAIDADDNVHIATVDQNTLRYLTRDAHGQWQTEVLIDRQQPEWASLYFSSAKLALTIGPDGRLHLAVQPTNSGSKFVYGVKTGTTWDLSIADPGFGGSFSRGISLALDAQARAHVGLALTNLVYGRREAGQWQFSSVDAAGEVGNAVSVGLDRQGFPILAYSDRVGFDLRLAVSPGGAWAALSAATTGEVGGGCSIAVASDGQLHVTHYHAEVDALVYQSSNSKIGVR